MKNIIRILAKIYFCYLKYRVKQFNTEYINGIEKCIICPNHSNKDDPAWILSSVKNTYAMAKLSLFKNKFYSIILHYLNTLPVKNNQINSIRNAINLLENNKNIKLLIFIEKTRIARKKRELGLGAIYLACKLNIPIIPVYITENVNKFSKVNIIYGKPIYYDKNLLENKQKQQEAADNLLNTIYSLKNEQSLN